MSDNPAFREVIRSLKLAFRGVDPQLVHPILDHIYGVHSLDEKALNCQIMKISFANNYDNVIALTDYVNKATNLLIDKSQEDVICEISNESFRVTVYRKPQIIPESISKNCYCYNDDRYFVRIHQLCGEPIYIDDDDKHEIESWIKEMDWSNMIEKTCEIFKWICV